MLYGPGQILFLLPVLAGELDVTLFRTIQTADQASRVPDHPPISTPRNSSSPLAAMPGIMGCTGGLKHVEDP